MTSRKINFPRLFGCVTVKTFFSWQSVKKLILCCLSSLLKMWVEGRLQSHYYFLLYIALLMRKYPSSHTTFVEYSYVTLRRRSVSALDYFVQAVIARKLSFQEIIVIVLF